MAIVLLDVFKALQVKSQDCWKLLNSHPLVRLLDFMMMMMEMIMMTMMMIMAMMMMVGVVILLQKTW